MIKASFPFSENGPIWKNGVIYVNKRIANPREDIWGLNSVAIAQRHRCQLQTGLSEEMAILDGPAEQRLGTVTRAVNLGALGENVVRTALQRLAFYRFSHLRGYFPHLRSIAEFIAADEYLGGVVVDLIGAEGQIDALTQAQAPLAWITDRSVFGPGASIVDGLRDGILARSITELETHYSVEEPAAVGVD